MWLLLSPAGPGVRAGPIRCRGTRTGTEHAEDGGGMYVTVYGEDNSAVSSNSVSMVHVTAASNTASGECGVPPSEFAIMLVRGRLAANERYILRESCVVRTETAGAGGGMYLGLWGYYSSEVTNNTLLVVHVTATGNAALLGEWAERATFGTISFDSCRYLLLWCVLGECRVWRRHVLGRRCDYSFSGVLQHYFSEERDRHKQHSIV
jgi:hypothetical protein